MSDIRRRFHSSRLCLYMLLRSSLTANLLYVFGCNTLKRMRYVAKKKRQEDCCIYTGVAVAIVVLYISNTVCVCVSTTNQGGRLKRLRDFSTALHANLSIQTRRQQRRMHRLSHWKKLTWTLTNGAPSVCHEWRPILYTYTHRL